jgi:hypothetical protein
MRGGKTWDEDHNFAMLRFALPINKTSNKSCRAPELWQKCIKKLASFY